MTAPDFIINPFTGNFDAIGVNETAGAVETITAVAPLQANGQSGMPQAGNVILTLAGSEGFRWITVTSDLNPIQIMENTGYICNGGTPVDFILPISPTVGVGFTIVSNETTFQIAQNASQQMFIGNDGNTIGDLGGLTSSTLGDQAAFIYMGSDIYRAFAPQGNLALF